MGLPALAPAGAAGNGTTPDVLERYLRVESNRALKAGTLYGAVFGLVAGTAVALLLATGAAQGVLVPCLFAYLAAASCAVIHVLARQQRVHGPVAYAVFIPLVSLPTVFFLAAQALVPAGAATYITGPFSYLYFFIISVTGFLLDARLSAACGGVAAAGYLLSYALAAPVLAQLAAPDPTMRQDLVEAPFYALKGMMMVGDGLLVAGLAVIARKLIHRVLHGEQEKASISRLFGQYVSDEVKEKLLADGGRGDGELKDVVVLFSDLRGFSTYSERRPPEEIVHHLNQYFDEMVDAITRHGGVIDKFIGDAVMAVFGGVLPLPDPCAAAVRAAHEMRARLVTLNAEWQAQGLPKLDNGIGMHFGQVLQGSIGSTARKDFTVIGDNVNVASRLEGLTRQHPFPILVTQALWEQLPLEVQARCTPLGRVKVKGKAEEVEILGVADAP